MRRTRLLAVAAALCLTGGLLPLLAATGAAPGTPRTAARAADVVPSPRDFFGFDIGTEGRLVAHDDMVRYLALAGRRSDVVDYHVLGRTTGGNDYPYLTISSRKNLRHLDDYLAINQRLADPRGLDDAQARALAQRAKPVLLIEAGIHSTEVGNVQAMAELVHRLATEHSAYTRKVLDGVILVIVPFQNPDGDEAVTTYFDQTAGTGDERVYPDLYQKYTGHDLNRDWFAFTQQETRLFLRLEQRVRPTVLHNMHQMPQQDYRMFAPPFKDPFNPSIDPRVVQQTNLLGMNMAEAVTASGRTGVSVGTTYDLWHSSVAYEPYHGVPHVLTELAVAKDLAYPLSSPDGAPLGVQRQSTNVVAPYDRSTWTLRQVVDYALTAVYANLETVADRGAGLLYTQYEVARDSVARQGDRPYAYVIPADQRDPLATYDLLKIMRTGEIDVDRADRPFTAGGRRYPAGSYVIRTQQRFGRWADMLMKRWDYPDVRDCPTCPLKQPYDVAAGTLWMLFGVTADRVEKPFRADLAPVRTVRPEPVRVPAPQPGAYVVPATSYAVGHVLAALQAAGVETYRAGTGLDVDGHRLAPGAIVVRADQRAHDALVPVAAATGIPVLRTASVPQAPGYLLKPATRIGLYRGIDNMPGGWVKWLLDQNGTHYREVGAQDFRGSLNARYDTIVLPSGVTRTMLVEGLDMKRYPKEWAWAAGIGEDGWARLREFVRRGGTLVALGTASETARRLLDLPVENVVPRDPAAFFVPGSLLETRFSPDQPLAWGMPERWPSWFFNDAAFRITGDSRAQVAAAYPDEPLLRSGYARGEEHLRGAVAVASFDIGKGHAVIAGSQLSFRAWSRATLPLLYNALYQGPSTSVAQILPR